MAITANYSILHDFPLINNPEALKAGRYSLEFHPEWKSRFAVVPRHGSAQDIRWFEADPRYMLHVANAWEEVNDKGETEIVMLGTPYAMPKQFDGSLDVKRLLFTIGTQGTEYEFYQWRFNLATGQTRESVVDDILNTEFPMINAWYQGHKNRYTYHVLMGRARTV
jgi:carotenoid cleavage dioxygenase